MMTQQLLLMRSFLQNKNVMLSIIKEFDLVTIGFTLILESHCIESKGEYVNNDFFEVQSRTIIACFQNISCLRAYLKSMMSVLLTMQ